MTLPVTAIVLGKYQKLFVGKTATSTADSDFVRVVNENDVTVDWKADNEKVMTKDAGKVTLPNGDEEYTIKFTADSILADPGLVIVIGAKNQVWPYQIRDVTNAAAQTVTVEGSFTLTDINYKAGEKGARQITGTLENFGSISYNIAAPRATTS